MLTHRHSNQTEKCIHGVNIEREQELELEWGECLNIMKATYIQRHAIMVEYSFNSFLLRSTII